jgi:type I restriction enzyme R subunit
VNYDVYKIDTEITKGGSKVGNGFYVDKRDRLTRKVRWEQLDEDLAYAPNELDRPVVAPRERSDLSLESSRPGKIPS